MRILIAVAVFILSWEPLVAGNSWMAVGIGGGSYGLAECFSGSAQIGKHTLISVRWACTNELYTVNGGYLSGESFTPEARDIGFLLGWVNSGGREGNSISASIGLGIVTVTEKGEWVDGWLFGDYWDKEQETTTGLMFQSQYFVKKFGFQVFADFNSIRSFGGVVVSYRILFGR